jgi:hypothetical protein
MIDPNVRSVQDFFDFFRRTAETKSHRDAVVYAAEWSLFEALYIFIYWVIRPVAVSVAWLSTPASQAKGRS